MDFTERAQAAADKLMAATKVGRTTATDLADVDAVYRSLGMNDRRSYRRAVKATKDSLRSGEEIVATGPASSSEWVTITSERIMLAQRREVRSAMRRQVDHVEEVRRRILQPEAIRVHAGRWTVIIHRPQSKRLPWIGPDILAALA